MVEVRTAHTGELDAATLAAARGVLEDAFDGDIGEHDWEHALGGIHALVWEGDELVGHASLVQRRMLHGGWALRAGYVEGVGVRTGMRGRGYAAAAMAALERLVPGGYDLGALASSDMARGFYAARGWQRWHGATWALTPTGVRRTAEEDGCVFVLQASAPLDLTADLTCDWRDGDLW